jgi:hypothetical protein
LLNPVLSLSIFRFGVKPQRCCQKSQGNKERGAAIYSVVFHEPSFGLQICVYDENSDKALGVGSNAPSNNTI